MMNIRGDNLTTSDTMRSKKHSKQRSIDQKSGGLQQDQWRAYSQTLSAKHLKALQPADLQHPFPAHCRPPLPPLPVAPHYNYEPSVVVARAAMQQQLALQQQAANHYPGSQFPTSLDESSRALTLSRPLCRCRVMYLGSSVPHITKNGLHGIQEPLRLLYPEEQFSRGVVSESGRAPVTTVDIRHLSAGLGIDSWLSVWSNGLLLQNVDELGQEVKRFFAIESLHYCAAVRYFDTNTLRAHDKSAGPVDLNNNSASGGQRPAARFLPLDAPLFQVPGLQDTRQPPVFAAILRRTSGIKVLECHAFVCRRDAAANALVRCCTHAYADLLNARRLSLELAAAAGRRQSWSPAGGAHTIGRRHQLSEARGSSSTSGAEPEAEDTRSSEDNYAIIARPRRTTEPASNPKGSCRSLYSDFQPRTGAVGVSDKRGSPKLSHSAELISRLSEAIEAQRQMDVQVKDRRHSRSMQNLGLATEFCASSARSSARLGAGRKWRSRPRASDAPPRSSSMHEMRPAVGEPVQPTEPTEPSESVESVPRVHSRRSRSGSRRKRDQLNSSQLYEVPRPPAVCHEPALVCAPQWPLCAAPTVAYLALGPDGVPLAPLGYGAAGLYRHAQAQQQVAALYAATLSRNARVQTLARFRCVSPPMNLVGATREQQEATGSAPADHKVVSGPPGFLAGRRAKRLSWIKRLSLTLSNGSAGSGPTESAADSGKRRASLFGGSLSLARPRSRPNAQVAECRQV